MTLGLTSRTAGFEIGSGMRISPQSLKTGWRFAGRERAILYRTRSPFVDRRSP